MNHCVANGKGFHEHTTVAVPDKAPTALEAGFAGRTACSECGSAVSWGVILPATGHVYSVVGNRLICSDCGKAFEGSGLQLVSGKAYYMIGGKLLGGWQSVEDEWYYFDTVTYAAVETLNNGYVTFAFEADGKLVSGQWYRGSKGFRYYYGPAYYVGAASAARWFEIDGKTYKAWHCVDSEVHEDDLYMILACVEEGAYVSNVMYTKYYWAYDLDNVYCLVVYNLKEKTQKLLATDEKVMREDMEYFYRPTDIEGIFGDRILLRAYTEPMVGRESTIGYYRDLEVEWYTVDLDGALLDTSVAYDNAWEWVSDEYLVAEIYNEENGAYDLYYRTSDLSEPIFIQRRTPGQRDIEWNYIEQNGVKGLLR
jgi:hypothetical protein